MVRTTIALLCGTLFGLGLSLSQMINPRKVQGFLDITGEWDASLAFVMIGALMVTMSAFRWVLKRPAPVFDSKFFLSTRTDIDWPLITGAALFGIGWGLSGYCPGPAVTGLSLMTWEPLIVLVSIIAGLVCQKFVSKFKL